MKALLVILLPLLVVPLVQAEMREWKTADESKTLVAEYVSSRAGKVTIRRKLDRRLFTLSLDKLSEQDREYVKQREEEGPGDGSGEAKDAEGEFANIPAAMRKRCLPEDRMQRLKENGGIEGCERAVVRALNWLQRTQARDGSWGGGYKVAYTGLALLAYLGHCETPQSARYGETVTKAIAYLVNKSAQNKGRLGGDLQSNQWVYEHAIATYAIAEAYTFCSQLGTNVPGLQEAVQLGGQAIIDGQNAAGGWTYRFSSERRNDSSVMSWCFQALKACKHTGIEFRNMAECVRDGLNAFAGNQHPSGAIGYTGPQPRGDGTTLSAAGALCFQLWGREAHSVPRKACAVINRNIKFNWKGKDTDLYGHYYASQAMINYGGKFWQEYNELFRNPILKAQNGDGSWPLPANTGHGMGNVHYVTCLATLMLEVYYRFVP
ncbi:MAG: hypothetical protein MK194_16330 [Roseibacillus sp.]|nr:hypothetical protein [Roseibacillus sp.]